MKNKEITIYELIGLIKDGKAPKKIKYDDNILSFDFETNNYRDNEASFLFGDYIYGQLHLNDTVKIPPEENDDWEDIEELAMLYNGNSKDEIMRNRFIINKLIKNQKYLKEKLEVKDESRL